MNPRGGKEGRIEAQVGGEESVCSLPQLGPQSTSASLLVLIVSKGSLAWLERPVPEAEELP